MMGAPLPTGCGVEHRHRVAGEVDEQLLGRPGASVASENYASPAVMEAQGSA
jgi:hypothetical protein